MAELEGLGTAQTRKTMDAHGAPANYFGVKVGDLKVIQKRLKKDQALALGLYATGNGDAQYLAGLICDPKAMTPEVLDSWANTAGWHMIAEYTVPWAAADSPNGLTMARKWIESVDEKVASSGWNAWSSLCAVLPDTALPKDELRELLHRCATTVHQQPNRVRYCMNGFVISVGSYVPDLRAEAEAAARQMGKVHVDVGGTACKVPTAEAYIAKVWAGGTPAKKRKTAFC